MGQKQKMTETGSNQRILQKFLDDVITWITEADGDLDDINDILHYKHRRDGVIGGNHTMVVGTSDTTMVRLSGICRYQINGIEYVASDVEGDLATGEITEHKWGAWRLMLDRNGAIQTQRATANGTSGTMAFDSEQEALMSLAQIAPSANMAEVGYWTGDAAAGGFTPGTDNPDDGDAQVDTDNYFNVYAPRLDNGLTAAPSVGLSEGTTDTQYAFGTIDVRTNGKNVAQIAADVTIAFAENDTITNGKYSGHLFITDVAGTAVLSLAATGVAGAAVAMTYNTAALANTALDAVQAALPNIFTVIGRMTCLANKSFTFNTDDVDGTDGTPIWTDEVITAFDRADASGTGVGPDIPTIPSTITAPIPSKSDL